MLKQEYENQRGKKPIFVLWLMSIGVAKSEKSANAIMIVCIIIFFIVSGYIFANELDWFEPEPLSEAELLQLPPELREIMRQQ